MKLAAVSAAVASALLLGACGGSDGGNLLNPASTPDSSSSAPADTEPSAAPDGPATPDTGSGSSGSSGGAKINVPAPSNGKAYTDPQSGYRMTINKRWVTYTGKDVPKGTEVWMIDAPDGDYRPNLNVTTEDLTGAAVGISMETYLRLSVQNLAKIGFKIVRQTTATSPDGQELGVVEYTGDPSGLTPDRHSLALLSLGQTKAAVVTMAAKEKTFKQHRKAALPYMVTVTALG